jgi:Tfp pilus assembly protein PilF
MISFTLPIQLVVSLLVLSSCATSSGPYNNADPQRRNTAEAERLTRKAADLIASDPISAEKLLREALAEDLFHGPAHNNLGVLFFEQDRLYEAAAEFEWARKLMPGHPDPRLNLGLVLERGGRIDDAIASYHAALKIAPEHLETTQALARTLLRHNRVDPDLDPRLQLIAMRGTPTWSDWAHRRLLERSAIINQP